MTIIRFDAVAQEVYDGPALTDPEKCSIELKSALKRDAGQRGTSLLRLLQQIAARKSSLAGSEIVVYTDAGTELMSRDELEKLSLTGEGLKDAGVARIVFVGVEAGQREVLRETLPEPLLVFEAF